MYLSHIIIFLFIIPSIIFSDLCDSFIANQVCPLTADNVYLQVSNVESESECQLLCRDESSCSFFSWVIFHSWTGLPPSCYLHLDCQDPEQCGDACSFSVLGPGMPDYPDVCCDLFSDDNDVCEGTFDNLVDLINDVSYIESCQELCQESQDCEYFLFNQKQSKCFLLSSCQDKFSCDSCYSGPDFPSMSSCELSWPTTSTTPSPSTSTTPHQDTTTPYPGNLTALLLGGFSIYDVTTVVSSYPCSLSIPDVPYKSISLAAAKLGSDIYLCGGYILHGGGYLDDCYVLGGDAQWRAGPKMAKKKENFSLNRVGDVLVAIGGWNGTQELTTVEVLRDGAWEVMDWNFNYKKVGHCTLTLNDEEVLVVGGYSETEYSDRVEKLNIVTGKVELVAHMPSPRSSQACVLHDNILIIAGGSYSNQGFTSAVETLDLDTLEWGELPGMNHKRFNHKMVFLNGRLAVFGGVGLGSANTREILESLDAEEWVTEVMDIYRESYAVAVVPC